MDSVARPKLSRQGRTSCSIGHDRDLLPYLRARPAAHTVAMSNTVDPPPSSVRELNRSQCWARLRESSVGRLAVVLDEQPDIFPINYVVDHGAVMFRTAVGSKLAGSHQRVVAFEVDDWDEGLGLAWSVVIKGQARKAHEPYEVLDALALPLTPWHGGSKPLFVLIEPTSITGREFTFSP